MIIQLFTQYYFISITDTICTLSYKWVIATPADLKEKLNMVDEETILFLVLPESKLDQYKELKNKYSVRFIVLIDSLDEAEIALREPNIVEFAYMMEDMSKIMKDWKWDWRLLPVLYVLDKEYHFSYTQKVQFVTSKHRPPNLGDSKVILWWRVANEISSALDKSVEDKRALVCTLYEQVQKYSDESKLPALLALATDALAVRCSKVFEELEKLLGKKEVEEVKYLILVYPGKALDIKEFLGIAGERIESGKGNRETEERKSEEIAKEGGEGKAQEERE